MTKSLNQAQRLAREVEPFRRSDAARLVRSFGQPFVHLGNERYGRLSETLYKAGIDPALELVTDRRSLLTWPLYLMAGQATLMMLISISRHAMTEEEIDRLYQGDHGRPVPDDMPLIEQFARVPLPDEPSPPLQLGKALATELAQVMEARRAQPEVLSEVPRSAADVTSLVNALAASVAVMALAKKHTVDSEYLRSGVSRIIHDPGEFIRSTHGTFNILY